MESRGEDYYAKASINGKKARTVYVKRGIRLVELKMNEVT